MSEIKTNKISPRKGTTTTITDSGDTVTVTSGANINNAGTLTINNLTNSGTLTSTGTLTTAGISGGTINNSGSGSITGLQQQINWQTGSIKTASFTASANEGYFLNTTSGQITVTLPASPTAGDVVAVKDYADTFDTNKAILNPNGNKIQGATSNFHITVEGTAAVFLYIDSTQGWKLVDQSKAADITEDIKYITATGGTVTTSGDFKIHTFTGPGTFCVSCAGNPAGNDKVSYMVVAGGGGGVGPMSGGGGAGGFRESKASTDCYSASPLNATSGPTYNLTVPAQAYPITVGAGGTGWNVPAPHTSGANSVFSTITSAGGGANPADGGSGSGGGRSGPSAGGSGNTPPVSPPQGQDGGGNGGGNANDNGGGGGGGAGAAGQQIPSSVPYPAMHGGDGGNGVTTSISASPVTRAGGGGGGHRQQGSIQPNGNFASGGSGGGGRSAYTTGPGSGNVVVAENGTANTGGGGGAPVYSSCNPPGPHVCNPQTDREQKGGNGGSGVVIIRYKFQN